MRGRSWAPSAASGSSCCSSAAAISSGAAFAIPFLISLAFYLARHNPESGGGGASVRRADHQQRHVRHAGGAVLPHQLPAAHGRSYGGRLHDSRRGGAGYAARSSCFAPSGVAPFVLAKWTMAMVYLGVGFLLMFASGLLFGGIFFGLHPIVTFSGTTASVPARPRAHHAVHALRSGGDVLHRLDVAALQHAHGLEPHGADRDDRDLHRHHGAHPVQLLRLAAALGVPLYLQEFTNFFRDPIYWQPILKGLGVFALWSGVLTCAAYLVFRRKDVLSWVKTGMPALVEASVALFLAAEVLVFAAIGPDALFLAGAWAIVAVVTASRRSPRAPAPPPASHWRPCSLRRASCSPRNSASSRAFRCPASRRGGVRTSTAQDPARGWVGDVGRCDRQTYDHARDAAGGARSRGGGAAAVRGAPGPEPGPGQVLYGSWPAASAAPTCISSRESCRRRPLARRARPSDRRRGRRLGAGSRTRRSRRRAGRRTARRGRPRRRAVAASDR